MTRYETYNQRVRASAVRIIAASTRIFRHKRARFRRMRNRQISRHAGMPRHV